MATFLVLFAGLPDRFSSFAKPFRKPIAFGTQLHRHHQLCVSRSTRSEQNHVVAWYLGNYTVLGFHRGEHGAKSGAYTDLGLVRCTSQAAVLLPLFVLGDTALSRSDGKYI